ncbi:hypothetical protein [Bacillus sp. FSL K6-3431]|uniref:hypothetical protein n=1 Tax=Bacillus sp. FSL K6-3431 TaxID=2921500 RepID=UPI0030FBD4C7
MRNQNSIEWLKDQMDLGKMTAEEANVELVRMERVRMIINSIPAQIRKSLNEAVKSGYLCRKKKDGRKPEVYYHPNFEHLANEERHRAERETLEALAGIVARPSL